MPDDPGLVDVDPQLIIQGLQKVVQDLQWELVIHEAAIKGLLAEKYANQEDTDVPETA